MPQAVSLQPLTAEGRVQSQVSECEIFGKKKKCTGTGFSPTNSVFLCQYHFTYVPYSSSTRFSYQKDKWAKPGNLPKGRSPPPERNREALDRKVFHLFRLDMAIYTSTRNKFRFRSRLTALSCNTSIAIDLTMAATLLHIQKIPCSNLDSYSGQKA
jgi:hypothetical protein